MTPPFKHLAFKHLAFKQLVRVHLLPYSNDPREPLIHSVETEFFAHWHDTAHGTL